MKKNLSLENIKADRRKSRTEKITSLIKKTVAEILLTYDLNDIDGQNILIFVSNVTLSADGRNATIFLEVIDNKIHINKNLLDEILNKNSAKIKKRILKKSRVKIHSKIKIRDPWINLHEIS